MVITFPDVEEQQKIVRQVERLFAIDDKIEARYTQAKAQVDKLPQSILAKAFRGELVEREAEHNGSEGLSLAAEK